MTTPDCGPLAEWSASQHRCVGKYGNADPINETNPNWPVCAAPWNNNPFTGECQPPACEEGKVFNENTNECEDQQKA